MKLLANENFPLLSVIYLREYGYDVVYIGEGLKSISDVMVMELAVAEERTILTFDRDYGELIFRFKVKPPKESFTSACEIIFPMNGESWFINC